MKKESGMRGNSDRGGNIERKTTSRRGMDWTRKAMFKCNGGGGGGWGGGGGATWGGGFYVENKANTL